MMLLYCDCKYSSMSMTYSCHRVTESSAPLTRTRFTHLLPGCTTSAVFLNSELLSPPLALLALSILTSCLHSFLPSPLFLLSQGKTLLSFSKGNCTFPMTLENKHPLLITPAADALLVSLQPTPSLPALLCFS